jgi:hypothetical protein
MSRATPSLPLEGSHVASISSKVDRPEKMKGKELYKDCHQESDPSYKSLFKRKSFSSKPEGKNISSGRDSKLFIAEFRGHVHRKHNLVVLLPTELNTGEALTRRFVL